MNDMKIFSIGKIVNKKEQVYIELYPKYSKGLKGLEGYSHAQVIWWANGCDNEEIRNKLIINKPYKKGPDEIIRDY